MPMRADGKCHLPLKPDVILYVTSLYDGKRSTEGTGTKRVRCVLACIDGCCNGPLGVVMKVSGSTVYSQLISLSQSHTNEPRIV